MKQATLSDFIALNDQLLALHQAGVPMNVVPVAKGLTAPETLERINAAVARSVGQGASIAQALEEQGSLTTPEYRCLMQVGLQSGDLSAALGGAQDVAEAVADARNSLRVALLYPAIVCLVAYMGLVIFCLFLVPRLQNFVANLGLPMGTIFSVVEGLRATLPYWVALPPIIMVVILFWIRRSDRNSSLAASPVLLRWVPGASRAILEERCANFAGTLASALEARLPADESLRLAAGTWPEADIAARLRSVAPLLVNSSPEAAAAAIPVSFPAFLRWAMVSSPEVAERASNLRMVAGVYRDTAARRLRRVRVVAPILACVLIAGSVTLLYGLVLFLPAVQLLRDLAQ